MINLEMSNIPYVLRGKIMKLVSKILRKLYSSKITAKKNVNE